VTETTVRSVPSYRPTPSVDKVRRAEFRALMEIVADAARELAEFVYVAWQAEDDGDRVAALRDGRCPAVAGLPARPGRRQAGRAACVAGLR
jgi:hypothetical protein